jgi:hypothetical protein
MGEAFSAIHALLSRPLKQRQIAGFCVEYREARRSV